MRKRKRVPLLLSVLLTLCCSIILFCSAPDRLVGAASGEGGNHALVNAALQSQSSADVGEWSQVYATADVPVHISLLPDGRLLYWGRDKENDRDVTGHTNTYLTNYLYLDNSAYTTMQTNDTTNLFCSGHLFLPDGRLLVTGGHITAGVPPSPTASPLPPESEFVEGLGEDDINIFDYTTSTWSKQATGMERGRWYPFNVTLATGETLIVAGTYWSNEGMGKKPTFLPNRDIEIRDLQGNLRKLTIDSTAPQIRYYPYMSLNPDGKVFMAKPSSSSNASEGEVSRLIDPFAINPVGGYGVYTAVGKPLENHFEGSSVMYAPGKVLMLGGSTAGIGGTQTSNAEYIDFTVASPAPQWKPAGSMAWARQFPTSTVLPDGKVLVTGGTSCPGVNNLTCQNAAVQTPELWDPATKTFQALRATTSQIPRVYHSTAMLLPDGTVLVGGGGLPAAAGEIANGITCQGLGGAADLPECRKFGHKDFEIFSPPYLFKADGTRADRPAIVSAPDTIAYGQSIPLTVGNYTANGASDIKEVVLIRLPSVTHTFNEDQRRVVLGNLKVGDADHITVDAPANGNFCPPGPYMMFLINKDRNTPSIAKIVRVGSLSLDSSGKSFPWSKNITGGNDETMKGQIIVTTPANLTFTTEVDSSSSSWITITGKTSTTDLSRNITTWTVNYTVADFIQSPSTRSGEIVFKLNGQSDPPSTYRYKVYQAGTFNDYNYQNDPFNNKAALAISRVFARSITLGCGSGGYCPDQNVLRGSMARFISRSLGAFNPPLPVERPFNDVPIDTNPSTDESRFVAYIKRTKITGGCSTGVNNYCPGNVVTRAEMAAFIMKALGVTNPPKPAVSAFDDVPANHWAAGFVEEFRRRGITSGCDVRRFCPDAAVTRKDMAVFLARAFGL